MRAGGRPALRSWQRRAQDYRDYHHPAEHLVDFVERDHGRLVLDGAIEHCEALLLSGHQLAHVIEVDSARHSDGSFAQSPSVEYRDMLDQTALLNLFFADQNRSEH